eukprot:INCI19885.1.p2 GENE.INCI19885.1~~INCI19885.1.p2  ORF type:complete len:136 (+),score=28.30 INCI19885.1:178-585(+)
MVAAKPINKMRKEKKRKKTFHRFQSDTFMRVDPSWRRPRGIDSRVRRGFKGTIAMVNIGYGNNKKTRHQLPNGLKAFRVSNVKELEVLLMHNRTFCAEICHNVSVRQRKEIVARAEQLRITVTNANARVETEEEE